MDVDSEDDAPQQQLPPTNTASPASNSSHSSSDNDDSDDENGQRTAAAAAQPIEVEVPNPSKPHSPTAPASSFNYPSLVEQRRALFRSAVPAQPAKGYSIESIFIISHSTHVNALAAPPCLSHLYTGSSRLSPSCPPAVAHILLRTTGGADGYIRRYALHATLNGTGVDNPAFNNFSMKVGGHTPSPTSDLRQPVLVGYWENEEPGDWMGDLLGGAQATEVNGEAPSKVKWGPKTGVLASQSPVYSLAVQSEELWGLSGTSVSFDDPRAELERRKRRADLARALHSAELSTSSPSDTTRDRFVMYSAPPTLQHQAVTTQSRPSRCSP